MPFLVRDVHGLSGLALAKAEPTAKRSVCKPFAPPELQRTGNLTSDQVHVDQVGFHVAPFLRLVPQTLRDPDTQTEREREMRERRHHLSDRRRLPTDSKSPSSSLGRTTREAGKGSFAPALPGRRRLTALDSALRPMLAHAARAPSRPLAYGRKLVRRYVALNQSCFDL